MKVDRVKSEELARQLAEAEYICMEFLKSLLREMGLDDGLERMVVNRLGPQAELATQSAALHRDLRQELNMFGREGWEKTYCAPISAKLGTDKK